MTSEVSSLDDAAALIEADRIDRLRQRSPQAFQAFYHENLTRVYRFHLALLGSVAAAQESCAETFRQAAGWIDTCPGSSGSSSAWLLELACGQSSSTRDRPKSAESALPPNPSGFDFQVFQIAEGLRPLPQVQSLLLTLHFFGGLNLPACARVLRLSTRRVEKLSVDAFHAWLTHTQPSSSPRSLAEEAFLAEDLFHFADQIQPEASFAGRLADGLADDLSRPKGQHNPPARTPDWRRSLFLQNWKWRAASLAGAAVLILALFFSFDLTPREGTPSRTPEVQENGPKIADAILDVKYQASIQGYLVPPGRSTCLDGGGILLEELEIPWRQTPVEPFTSISNTPERNGAGCVLRATVNGSQEMNSEALYGRISALLADAGYSPLASVLIDPLTYNISKREFWFGQAGTFTQDKRMVFLAVGWSPVQPEQCSPDGRVFHCKVPPEERQVSLRIELGEDRLRPQIEAFFERWTAGEVEVADFMDPALQARLQNLDGLDRQAGVGRSLTSRPSFSWRVLENDGDHVRLQVEAVSLARRDAFQVIWQPLGDDWQVTDIQPGAIFPPTGDKILVADLQGRVALLDLKTGASRALSPAGVYLPRSNADPFHQPLVSVSPGGEWLAVSPGQEGPSWLIALDGKRHIKIANRAIAFSWSPDGSRISLVLSHKPDTLYEIDPDRPVLHRIIQMHHAIQDIAWAPDGEKIGLAEFEPAGMYSASLNAKSLGTTLLSVYNREEDRVWGLWSQEGTLGSPPNSLTWTEDSEELWYRNSRAFQVSSGDVRLILVPPGMETILERFGSPGSILQQFYSAGLPRIVFSPDGRRRAQISGPDSVDSGNGVIAIQEFLQWGTNQVIQRLWPVSVVEWTREGENLILASAVDRSGAIRRMNPLTGEVQEITDGVVYIGVLSHLERTSRSLAPAVNPAPVPEGIWKPSPAAEWLRFERDPFAVSFQYPPGWSIYTGPSRPTTALLVLSNLHFDRTDGWYSLEDGDFVLRVTQRTWNPGENPFTFWRQFYSTGIGPKNTFMIDGRQAVIRQNPEHPHGIWEGSIPTPEMLITFYYYSTGSLDERAIFQQIVESMRIRLPATVKAPPDTTLSVSEWEKIQAVEAAAERVVTETSLSPNGQWQAQVERYGCVRMASGESSLVEELLLVNLPKYATQVIERQLRPCQDSQDSGISLQFWAQNSRFLYYTKAGDGEIERPGGGRPSPLSAVEVSQNRAVSLGTGQISPSGSWLAYWDGRDLVVWDLNGGETLRERAAIQEEGPGPIAWSPDEHSLVFVKLEQDGSSTLVRMQLDDSSREVLLKTQQPRMLHLDWLLRDVILIQDENGQEWGFNPLIQTLTPPG